MQKSPVGISTRTTLCQPDLSEKAPTPEAPEARSRPPLRGASARHLGPQRRVLVGCLELGGSLSQLAHDLPRHAKAFPIESCLNQHPILFMQVEDSYCFLLGIYWSHMFFLYPVTRGGVL